MGKHCDNIMDHINGDTLGIRDNVPFEESPLSPLVY